MPSAAPLSSYPLLSSKQIITVISKLGARPGKSKRGSHASYIRTTPDGRTLVATVLLGRKEMRRGALKRILEGLEISLEDFKDAL